MTLNNYRFIIHFLIGFIKNQTIKQFSPLTDKGIFLPVMKLNDVLCVQYNLGLMENFKAILFFNRKDNYCSVQYLCSLDLNIKYNRLFYICNMVNKRPFHMRILLSNFLPS